MVLLFERIKRLIKLLITIVSGKQINHPNPGSRKRWSSMEAEMDVVIAARMIADKEEKTNKD